ncbi:MAG TPA: endo-1,4-beta-xylanase [Longimicrobiaceae bacterium]|nr:endo-1,4-beta-xylanase [Longimicrobiaceae bacterium]
MYHRSFVSIPVVLLAASLAWACSGDGTGPGGGSGNNPPPDTASTTPPVTLRSRAEAHDLYVGSAAATGLNRGDAAYADTLAAEFDMVTPENAMKFDATHPQPGLYTFAAGDTIVAFAEKNGMKVRGHTLVWQNQLPDWVRNGTWTKQSLSDTLKAHIQNVVGHYKGKIHAWDVVNEPFNGDGTLQSNIFLQTIGPDYIELAFRWAHEADPDAKLYLNEYGAEDMGTKSDSLYALVSRLKADGVPIDGVGMQMHLATQYGAPSTTDLAANMKRLGDLGLKVEITEMDVRTAVPTTADGVAKQVQMYRDVVGACRAASNCDAIVFWGFTDKYSWVPSTFTGQGAALLYDASYHRKETFAAVLDALQ